MDKLLFNLELKEAVSNIASDKDFYDAVSKYGEKPVIECIQNFYSKFLEGLFKEESLNLKIFGVSVKDVASPK